ncbi:MAG: calcium/sodium antiporter [Kofleriaceae bacterium]|nr:calcium/sodium antiporter [Kofleriaceae bacterium]
MFTTFDILQLVVGIGLLYWGAEWLIRGSASMARAFGVKPLVIGLTVVAYGTSAPELAVATKAVLDHAQPLALGTVIGACAANISLILGLTALISPPVIDRRIIRREVPILVGSTIAVPICLIDGVISRVEGLALIGCAVLFTIATLTLSARLTNLDGEADPTPDGGPDGDRREDDRAAAADSMRAAAAGASYAGASDRRPRVSRTIALLMAAAGLLILVVGSSLFYRGARNIGHDLGMSERMLGLTVIALGCSLPELITSLVAASRGHAALAVGSVLGSNLLNVFWVLGVVAYLRPIRVGERMHVVDLIGLVVITLLGVLSLRGARRISRLEGAILVAAYVAFVAAAAIF